MSLVLLGFMNAFPSTLVTKAADADKWEIGRIVGPLPAGARIWLLQRNVQPVGYFGGWSLRWIKDPHIEERDLRDACDMLTHPEAYHRLEDAGLI